MILPCYCALETVDVITNIISISSTFRFYFPELVQVRPFSISNFSKLSEQRFSPAACPFSVSKRRRNDCIYSTVYYCISGSCGVEMPVICGSTVLIYCADLQCAAIKKTPVNKCHYFWYSSIFFTKFSEIILDTICHYCCKFYRLFFLCLEVAQFWM